jgi:NADPH:quinone reductase-like Zn-dependent oxidoreductase
MTRPHAALREAWALERSTAHAARTRDDAVAEWRQVTPPTDRTCPLRETAAAVRYVQDGHARGKVVVAV